VGKADDAGAKGLLSVAFGEAGDKAAVDFDDVDLEGVELGERGVARAEVVERETDPGATEARETVTVGVAAVEEDAFGDFEDDGVSGTNADTRWVAGPRPSRCDLSRAQCFAGRRRGVRRALWRRRAAGRCRIHVYRPIISCSPVRFSGVVARPFRGHRKRPSQAVAARSSYGDEPRSNRIQVAPSCAAMKESTLGS
jgi:hypothetical protein